VPSLTIEGQYPNQSSS